MKPLHLALISTVVLCGCSMQESIPKERVAAEGNVGAVCSSPGDCQTPMDYLIRSSCPFTSLCIEDRCAVVCPMAFHNPDPQISKSHAVQCSADADCDCGGYASNDIARCACIDSACVAIVQE